MTITYLNEEHRQLVERLWEVYRRPVYDDPDLQADYEDLEKDVRDWTMLWFGYHNPSSRTSFTDEQQLDFEGKYERCARVDKLSDIARACELKVAEEIKTLRTAIMELNQKEAKRG
jgi:hypothetical protein